MFATCFPTTSSLSQRVVYILNRGFFFGGSVFNKVLVRGLCVSVSTANCESSGSAWLSWHWHFSSLYSLGQQPSWWRPRQTTTPPVSSGWRPADPPPPPSAWLSACSSKTGCLGAGWETSCLQKEINFLPFSVFLVLAIFLFARVQIVCRGLPLQKIAWLHGR